MTLLFRILFPLPILANNTFVNTTDFIKFSEESFLMVYLHKFPKFEQNKYVFLGRGQTLTVCGPHWYKRYIRTGVKYFLKSSVFMLFMNFPTYILTHPSPILSLDPSPAHSMTYPHISFESVAWRELCSTIWESFVKWKISVLHKLLIHHH